MIMSLKLIRLVLQKLDTLTQQDNVGEPTCNDHRIPRAHVNCNGRVLLSDDSF